MATAPGRVSPRSVPDGIPAPGFNACRAGRAIFFPASCNLSGGFFALTGESGTQHRGLRLTSGTCTGSTLNTIVTMTRLRLLASAFALLILGTGAFAPAVHAQAASGTSSTYSERVTTHIKQLLNDRDPIAQKRGLNLIIELSEREDSKIDLSAFRESLYRIYFNVKEDDDVRIGAIDALAATDNVVDRVNVIVERLQSDPSPSVRQHTLQVLSQYNEG